ncbi:hypothetical protein HanXRQr2_Chr02g0055241 [Helianthus annuus]|uniref:Uncharacterized protein n=2 Tax=Helianthus annuus TaxID=4232 RepID=A0A9K3NYW8_HELAN|nr:hypothetical protein HanXRQr2_Chr02g0055241 [Helianthus annuus]
MVLIPVFEGKIPVPKLPKNGYRFGTENNSIQKIFYYVLLIIYFFALFDFFLENFDLGMYACLIWLFRGGESEFSVGIRVYVLSCQLRLQLIDGLSSLQYSFLSLDQYKLKKAFKLSVLDIYPKNHWLFQGLRKY